MKKIVGISALVILTTSVSGCGWLLGDKGMFRDRSDDYRKAALGKPLVLPAGLTGNAIEDQLAIPREHGTEAALEGEFAVPRPEPINPSADAERVKLQTLGGQSWILVDAAPGEVWPRVRQFLSTNQLAVLRADATAGMIETAWMQPATGGARERYQFRIEQGVQRGSSEVYLLQADSSAGEASWPQHSSNAQRESDMLKAVAQFVADNGSSGAVSMLAQKGINAQGKVFLEHLPGQPVHLRLALPFDRAWASLGLALTKAGFATDETNASEHQLWVRYDPVITDEAKKPGFFGSIWHWVFGSDDGDILSNRKAVYVVSMQAGAEAGQQLIAIARQDQLELAPTDREKLLNMIKSNLN